MNDEAAETVAGRVRYRLPAAVPGWQTTWTRDLEPMLAEQRERSGRATESGAAEVAAEVQIDCHAEVASDGELPPHRHVDLALGATKSMGFFDTHLSILTVGHCPHPPHVHPEEELLIVIEGSPEIELTNAAGESRRYLLRPGSVAYYPTSQAHTIHNAGPGPATYLMYHWRGAPRWGTGRLATGVFATGVADGFVFNGATAYLGGLRCWRSTREISGSAAHDLGLVVEQGNIALDGQSLGPGGVAFVPAGAAYRVRKVSDDVCYLVIEFEAAGGITPVLNRVSGGLRDIVRRVVAAVPRDLVEHAPARVRELARRFVG